MLDKINVILGILILILAGALAYIVSIDVYSCNSFEEQVQMTNEASLGYWDECIEANYGTVLISPISLQAAVYWNSKETPKLFKTFNNGYKSWEKSGEIFEYGCLDSEDGCAIFNLQYGIADAVYCAEDDVIVYQGGVYVADGVVKLQLVDDRYAVYLLSNSIRDYTAELATEEKRIVINPFVWSSDGVVYLAGSEIPMSACFGFDAQNHEVVESVMDLGYDEVCFDCNYYIVVVDDITGLIMALGKRS